MKNDYCWDIHVAAWQQKCASGEYGQTQNLDGRFLFGSKHCKCVLFFNYYNNKRKKTAFFCTNILVFQKKAVPLHRPNKGLN